MALQTTDLKAGYGHTKVLHGVDLAVEQGSVLALLGRNGVGKTTFVKAVMGIIAPSDGTVHTLGVDTTHIPPFRKARSGIAYVPQDFGIFDQLTVAQNLSMATPDLREVRNDGHEIFEHFPVLGERLGQKAGTLSGGERKMLLIARALYQRPKLMLVDEVTEGVQPAVVERIAEAITGRVGEGTAVLLVEQRLEFALEIADYFSVLHAGEVVASGPVDAGARSRIEQHMVLT